MNFKDGILSLGIAEVIASLSSDDIKMEYLSHFDDNGKNIIIMSLSSDERKIELMKSLPDYYQWKIISSLSSDKTKADMLTTLPDIYGKDTQKSLIIASMSSEYPQLSDLISEIGDENLRTVLEACFSDDDGRVDALIKIDSFKNINSLQAENYRKMILEKLSSDKGRLQALEIINEKYKSNQTTRGMLNSQIVSSLNSDDKKVELLESGLYGYGDDYAVTSIISSLSSDDKKMRFLGDCGSTYLFYTGGPNYWEKIEHKIGFYRDDIIASLSISDEEKLAMAGASQFITNASPSLVKGLKSDKIKMTYIEEKTNIKSPLQQREEELSSLENEEKKISEAEALIEQQKEGQDRGE